MRSSRKLRSVVWRVQALSIIGLARGVTTLSGCGLSLLLGIGRSWRGIKQAEHLEQVPGHPWFVGVAR